MNGVEAAESLAVRAAVDGQLQLFERAGFGIGKLTWPADSRG
jgi:hypothetical protein